MKTKSTNIRLKLDQIAEELGCSSSTLQRYGQDENMLSPYRIPPKTHKKKTKISNRVQDIERLQLTSSNLDRP